MDMEKLIKILGMTGSAHDGEALSALRMAQRLMAANGKTWKDLIGAPRAQQPGWDPFAHARENAAREAVREAERARAREEARRATEEASRRSKPPDDDLALKLDCLFILDERPDLLTEWENEFLESFRHRPDHWSITEKQRAVFERILARYRKQK
jgi:hypothetical protein